MSPHGPIAYPPTRRDDVVEEPRVREAAVGEAALLGERHQLLDVRTKFLRLGERGGDLLMLDEGRRLVAEQRETMARGALELTTADTMTHGDIPSVRPAAVQGTAGQAVKRHRPNLVLSPWGRGIRRLGRAAP